MIERNPKIIEKQKDDRVSLKGISHSEDRRYTASVSRDGVITLKPVINTRGKIDELFQEVGLDG